MEIKVSFYSLFFIIIGPKKRDSLFINNKNKSKSGKKFILEALGNNTISQDDKINEYSYQYHML